MSYADLDGRPLYYAEHGADSVPLVLLHGGIGAGETLAPIVPALAAHRRVVVADLPGHGHSPDSDGPHDPVAFADDVARLVDHLGAGPCDVLGYSLGGMTALRLAVQHPAAVRRLVLVSVPCRRAGSHADALAAMDAMSAALAEPLKQSPLYAAYAAAAPDPDAWERHIAKTAEGIKRDYDWRGDVPKLPADTMLVYADADSIRPDHVVEFYGLLGGGRRDAGVDGSGRAPARLAVLPGRTHYDVLQSPLLVPAVLDFLG